MNLFHTKFVRILVILISFGLCLSAGGTILDLWHRRDLVINRQKDLTRITTENQALKRQLDETKSESYVERIARDKLGLVKDGENIILLPQSNRKDTKGGIVFDYSHTWQKWWKLFF